MCRFGGPQDGTHAGPNRPKQEEVRQLRSFLPYFCCTCPLALITHRET